jgi:hypothetical protein
VIRLDKIKAKFDEGRRLLIASLTETDERRRADLVKQGLEHIERAFGSIFMGAFRPLKARSTGHLVESEPDLSTCEFLCVHAINYDDGWRAPDWRVIAVNGDPYAAPHEAPTVKEFTQHMIRLGWKMTSAAHARSSPDFRPSDDPSVYSLYFFRERMPSVKYNEDTVPITDPPDRPIYFG